MDQLLDQVFQTYKHMNEKLKLYQSMSKKMERKVSVYGKNTKRMKALYGKFLQSKKG